MEASEERSREKNSFPETAFAAFLPQLPTGDNEVAGGGWGGD